MKLHVFIFISVLCITSLKGKAQLFQIGDRTDADFILLGTNFDNTISTEFKYKHITAPKGIEGPFSTSVTSSIWVFEAGFSNNYRYKHFTISPTAGIKWIPAIVPFVFVGIDYAYNISSNATNFSNIRYNYGITIWGMANIGISTNIFMPAKQDGIINNKHFLFMQIPVALIGTNFFDRRMRTQKYKPREVD